MNIIFYVIILLLFYFITNTEHFEPLYATNIKSSYITNNINKCCLVEKKYLSNKKELHGGNFKYVYTPFVVSSIFCLILGKNCGILVVSIFDTNEEICIFSIIVNIRGSVLRIKKSKKSEVCIENERYSYLFVIFLL
jgi:uncharacterized membrane protein YoaK (UPF0700 family)